MFFQRMDICERQIEIFMVIHICSFVAIKYSVPRKIRFGKFMRKVILYIRMTNSLSLVIVFNYKRQLNIIYGLI
ncbi:hypothetical protein BKA69DRAFT_1086946, partial [Paraphysoderma sedebokerense]